MSEKNDGGPAFPLAFEEIRHGFANDERENVVHHGLSMRDYFAAHALMGWMAQPNGEFSFQWKSANGEIRYLSYGATPADKDGEGWHIVRTPNEAMAAHMYSMADAMLKERAK